MSSYPKIVETPHYHVWTDALHARALARQARNKWDRGTYVRWCVSTAWIALEIGCQEATGEKSVSYSFKRNLDEAISRLKLPALNWGSGVWQRVAGVQERRKGYVHRFLTEADLFPNAEVADEAVSVIREAVLDIYTHVGQPSPPWITDNEDRGWDKGKGSIAHATLVHAGADPGGDDNLRICYLHNDVEHTADVLPPETKWEPHIDKLLGNIRVPISEVRVYRGNELIEVRKLRMRGT